MTQVSSPPTYNKVINIDSERPQKLQLGPSCNSKDSTPQLSPSVYLFEDEYSKFSSDQLILKCYYFPTTQNKKIKISDIRGIYYKEQSNDCAFESKGWGKSLSPVWWACDMFRNVHGKEKHYYNVIIDCEEKTYKGFSTTDINRFLQSISPHLNDDAIIFDDFPFNLP